VGGAAVGAGGFGLRVPRVEGERPWRRHWPAHVPPALEYPSAPAWWLLERSAERFPERIAVRQFDPASGEEQGSVSYRQLWGLARRVAAGLRAAGVRPGDRVAFRLANSPELIACFYGSWICGAVGVPCNPANRERETAFVLEDASPRVFIEDAAQVRGLAAEDDGLPPAGCEPERDVALLLYTGGTTGEPKGAMLTHANLVANTLQFARWFDFQAGDEVCVAAIPMCHSGGMAGVMNVPLFSGATLLVFPRFRPAPVVRAAERLRATRLFGVPTMYVGILNEPQCRGADLSALRACRTNAAPLPPAVKEAFDGFVGHEVLVEGYGLTETSPLTHANPIDRPRPGSIGIPLPDTDARVVDPASGAEVPAGQPGELCLRGPQVMLGYWGRPDRTAEVLRDGWLRTGDVACQDADGYFRIVDRMKDVIISSGFKVWPREVEEVLYRHPAVRLAAVVGLPDEYRGEAVTAFVVLKEGHAPAEAEGMIEHCRSHLAGYKVPRRIEIRADLPVSGAGKVLRRLLKAEAGREVMSPPVG
jgi:long-chain acyl-CoA synthetase